MGDFYKRDFLLDVNDEPPPYSQLSSVDLSLVTIATVNAPRYLPLTECSAALSEWPLQLFF